MIGKPRLESRLAFGVSDLVFFAFSRSISRSMTEWGFFIYN